MSTTCFRYDVAPIEKYELTPEGYLRCWSTIARTGVQMYTDADGSVRREYRPETEVASPESLASFAGKAITLEHPPVLLIAPIQRTIKLASVAPKWFMTMDSSVLS